MNDAPKLTNKAKRQLKALVHTLEAMASFDPHNSYVVGSQYLARQIATNLENTELHA